MVGQAIRWMLIGDAAQGNNPQSDIANLIGDNIYPNVLPQNKSLPAIVYTIDNNNPDKVKEKRALNNRVFFDIEIVDKSYAVVNQLSTLVINQLHRYTNSYNSNDSDGIGYGTTGGSSKYGKFAPASTGTIQYVGGLQIQYLELRNAIESYDDKRYTYRNTLNFEIVFIDDLTTWGADTIIKLTDFNLMATNVGATDDPLYTQPLLIDQGVNYIFSPSVPDLSKNVINGNIIYEHFYDPSGTSNTNRPTIKTSIENPPKYNSNNYLEFASSKYLLSSLSNKLNKKYKELTFFCVATLPNSEVANTTNCSAVLFKRNSTTENSGAVFFKTEIVGDPAAGGLVKFYGGGMALEDDGAGGEDYRGFNFIGGIVAWPLFGILDTLSFEDPFYFAVSFKRKIGDNTKLEGQYELITSSDFSIGGLDNSFSFGGDRNNYKEWSDNSINTFKEWFFNFETIHSDITSFDTKGGGGITDMNFPINLYDFVMWPESLTFGTNKYMQIKKDIIQKHNMFERTTN